MSVQRSSSSRRVPSRIVIGGGGFAAAEAMMAIRALCGDDAHITLVSPRPTFDYRPAATAEAFADAAPPLRYDLRTIADDHGAVYVRDAVAAVAPAARQVRLTSFGRLDYDALVLAVGARPRASVPGAITFRDQRDVGHVRRVLEQIDAGSIERLVFAVPAGVSWPLPVYELALMAAARADDAGLDAEVAIVTPEADPLEALGPDASSLVGRLLADGGVRFIARSTPAAVHREGRLELHCGGSVRADRVVAVPALLGRGIAGIPASWNGFVPVDGQGRVAFLDAVYAAGDMTTFPLKQGGVATQQADVIARTIAATIAGSEAPAPAPPLVQVRLLGGERPLALRIRIDAEGRPGETELLEDAEAAPLTSKVLGAHLEAYLPRYERAAA